MMDRIRQFFADYLSVISITSTIILSAVAAYGMHKSIASQDYIMLAISTGAIGGLVHEFFQSGGKILYFKKYDDGFYLGSVGGMLLGAVAGIIYIRGELGSLPPLVVSADLQQLCINIFLAGLGLKGVAEAVGGKTPDNGTVSRGTSKKDKRK